MSFETPFLPSLFKYFFVCLSRKTLNRFFILLHQCFYSCKPQIRTKQTCLTIWFAVPQKNICSYVQKIKNKHGGAEVACFVSACITHSLVERLSTLTVLLGNKDKSSRYVEAKQWRSINVGFNDLIPKETYITKWRKKLPAKKTV